MKPSRSSRDLLEANPGIALFSSSRAKGLFKKILLLVIFLSAGVAVWKYGIPEITSRFGTPSGDDDALARVCRGDLEIVVLEGGSLNALNSLELKSQVQGRESKILSIIEEGYEVTAEDVEEKKVLIKLDPTETKEKIEAHEIEYENAQTGVTDTDEARAIQVTESQNEISEARQKARFALLDFEKYLGDETAGIVLGLRKLPATEDAMLEYETNFQNRLTAGKKKADLERKEEVIDNASVFNQVVKARIKFSDFLENEQLGDGEAQQELRKRQDELLVAQSEHAVQIESIEGSERLKDKEFITKATLDKERVALKKAMIKELSATTQLELFRRYEFPKKAEELLTNYEDALRSIDIEKKEALAKLTQAEAKFRNAEQILKMAEKKRKELQEQLEACTIYATTPGLVVYGSSDRSRSYYGNNEKIEEGATIGYKRTIITIPDMTQMVVKVSIQESHIKKIKVDQKVRLIADAEPEKTLTGVVKKVAVLPDSNRWYANPNQKVYPTDVHIDGSHDWLKPGMSAKVEIIVNQLNDVLYVPLQSVVSDAGETVVWVRRGEGAVRQVVQIGDFTNDFIEIKEGLEEGEMVYLVRPDSGGGEEDLVEIDTDIAKSL
ncbi:MAG: HlyD family efflux transporter periplasmic adaptor subunit [Verrucomicrobiales bacterium]|nr:HlyD family efflux transporter periplasmic adaptor subunit [Verrucomicrobiales bacterium]